MGYACFLDVGKIKVAQLYVFMTMVLLSYFISLVRLFLGLLVTFWKLVFGENIFVLD